MLVRAPAVTTRLWGFEWAPEEPGPFERGCQPLSRMAWICCVGGIEQGVDVGVLVGQDRLHDRVEGGVQLLGVGDGSVTSGWSKIWDVNDVICAVGTLM